MVDFTIVLTQTTPADTLSMVNTVLAISSSIVALLAYFKIDPLFKKNKSTRKFSKQKFI